VNGPVYYLSVRWTHAASSVAVNGVPLVVDAAGGGIATDVPINLWLPPGENELSVFLRWPTHAPYEAGVAAGEAHAYLHDPSADVPTPALTLARFEWPPPVGPEVYPFTIRLPMPIKEPPPSEVWDQAEVLKELSEADRGALESLAADLIGGVRAGDAPRAFDLQEYKWRETARAEYKDFERVRKAGLEQLEWLAQRPGLRAEPLSTEDLVFDLAAGGRVALVTRSDARSPVLLEDDEGLVFELPIYAARLKGRWTLVR